jgi:D-alanyl-D-alanine carboxypeptidase
MRGKTGTINGVNALSGIIAMPGGRFRYFSIMVNHHIGDAAKRCGSSMIWCYGVRRQRLRFRIARD